MIQASSGSGAVQCVGPDQEKDIQSMIGYFPFPCPMVCLSDLCLHWLDVLIPEEEGDVPAQVDAVGVVVDGGAG